MSGLSDFEKQTEALLGITHQVVGKTQARKEFFPLVDSLAARASAVAITDHNKPVAVLLSYHHYMALAAKLAPGKSGQFEPRSMLGSIHLKVENLDAASDEIAEEFHKSNRDSAESL